MLKFRSNEEFAQIGLFGVDSFIKDENNIRMIYKEIQKKISQRKKQLSILLDPDKFTFEEIDSKVNLINQANIDFLLYGGSLIASDFEEKLQQIKSKVYCPVIIFPGSILQISSYADGFFLLSLISGRNPELLIGDHVKAVYQLKKSKLEILPVGYVLIDGGSTTSVGYMSNTTPIPSNKPDIALATSLAGEMLGLKLIYLDAGSGAISPVPGKTIQLVKQQLNIPLIVGGGIRSVADLQTAYNNGADIVVIGTAFEENENIISEFASINRI